MSSRPNIFGIAALVIAIPALALSLLTSAGVIGGNSIPGASGSTGPAGATGEAGAQGEVGESGLQGEAGAAGITGSAGARGKIGATGKTGKRGATGGQGVAGNDGADGLQGLPGLQGLQGIQGPAGIQGEPGPQGEQGEPGPRGPAGIGSALSTSMWFSESGGIQQTGLNRWWVEPSQNVVTSSEVSYVGGNYRITQPGLYRVHIVINPRQSPIGSATSLVLDRKPINEYNAFATIRAAMTSNFTASSPSNLELTGVFRVDNAGEELRLYMDSPDITTGSSVPSVTVFLQIDRIQ